MPPGRVMKKLKRMLIQGRAMKKFLPQICAALKSHGKMLHFTGKPPDPLPNIQQRPTSQFGDCGLESKRSTVLGKCFESASSKTKLSKTKVNTFERLISSHQPEKCLSPNTQFVNTEPNRRSSPLTAKQHACDRSVPHQLGD